MKVTYASRLLGAQQLHQPSSSSSAVSLGEAHHEIMTSSGASTDAASGKAFILRLITLLPAFRAEVAQSETSEQAAARALNLAFALHAPYVGAPESCQPFRRPLLEVASQLIGSNGQKNALGAALEHLLSLQDSYDLGRVSRIKADVVLESFGSAPSTPYTPKRTVQRTAAYPSSPSSSAAGEADVDEATRLLFLARDRSLTMGEARRLQNALQQLSPILLSPGELLSVVSHNAQLSLRILHRIPRSEIEPYLEALSHLEPSMRALDLLMRLLQSQVGVEGDAAKMGLLCKRFTLGPWLGRAVSYIERAEESGELEEDRVGDLVRRLCTFIRALITSGILRRNAEQALAHDADAQAWQTAEQDQAIDEACLVECRHFALRYGRYRDAGEVFALLVQG